MARQHEIDSAVLSFRSSAEDIISSANVAYWFRSYPESAHNASFHIDNLLEAADSITRMAAELRALLNESQEAA